MISKKEITTFQLVFVLIQSQVATGVISLPFDIFTKAKGDAWISILLTGIIMQMVILLYGALMHRFPSSNLYDIVQILFGKIIGKGIIILYTMHFIFVSGVMLSEFAYILKSWMLPLTPKWALLALICFTAILIVKNNLQVLARFAVVTSVCFISFIGLTIYTFKFATLTYILPVGEGGILPIIQGIPTGMYSFQPIEILLVIYPFVQSTNKGVLKAATIANIFVTFLYTSVVLASLLLFSGKALMLAPEPVLYMVKSLSFKVVERPDLLFTSMWIVLVTTTLMSLLYVSTIGISKVMNSNKLSRYAVLVATACFLLGMTFQGVYEIDSTFGVLNHIIMPFFWGLPILLLLISITFNKKEEAKGK